MFRRELIFGALLVALAAGPSWAARFDVDALDDAVDAAPGDGACADSRGLCTLRAAVQETNALAGADEIVLGPGVHRLSIVGFDEDEGATGDLDVLDELTIRGAGPDESSIEAIPPWDDATIHQPRDMLALTIEGLTLRGRPDAAQGAGIRAQGEPVTIRNVAFVEHSRGAVVISGFNALVEDCTFRDNTNGVLYADSFATLRRSTFLDNRGGLGVVEVNSGTVEDCRFERNQSDSHLLIAADVVRTELAGNEIGSAFIYTVQALRVEDCRIIDNAGGGVSLAGFGPLHLIRTEVRNNEGEGVYIGLNNEVLIDSCTISGNTSAWNGGGIEAPHGPELTLVNCTITGNTATEWGGGLHVGAANRLRIFNSTIAGNSSLGDEGGGLFLERGQPARIENTIIAGNSAAVGPDCVGDIRSTGQLLIGDPSGCNYTPGPGDLSGVDPLLGPLQDNGGPTATQALLADSPAIDAGSSLACLGLDDLPLPEDQRGSSRHVDGDGDGVDDCDIGAYEFSGLVVPGAGLVERLVDLTPPNVPERVAASFDPACQVAPWRPCPDMTWPGPLDALVLADVVSGSAEPSVTYYEHSDPVSRMWLELIGGDLHFSLR